MIDDNDDADGGDDDDVDDDNDGSGGDDGNNVVDGDNTETWCDAGIGVATWTPVFPTWRLHGANFRYR